MHPEAVFSRRRRDSNPRTVFGRYTISSRAPSTKLGDFSSWPKVRAFALNGRDYIKNRTRMQEGQHSFHENYTKAGSRVCRGIFAGAAGRYPELFPIFHI